MTTLELHDAKLPHNQDMCDACLDFKLDMLMDAELAEAFNE